MIKTLPIALVLSVAAAPVAAQDLPDFEALAEKYLQEAIVAAQQQAKLGERETAPKFVKLIQDDERWMNPSVKPGIGAMIGHFAMYDAQGFTLGAAQIANDAARVTAQIKYTAFEGIDWPAQVDFIRVNDVWTLRDVRLTKRTPLPDNSPPDEVLIRFIDDYQRSVDAIRALPDRSWKAVQLTRHWAFGGGYWQRNSDCQEAVRRQCFDDLATNLGLHVEMLSSREKTFEVIDFKLGADTAEGNLRVTTKTRSATTTDNWTVNLRKHRRFGWQIASIAKIVDAQPDAPPATLAIDNSTPEALVLSILNGLLGPGAPKPSAFLEVSTLLAPHFADTRSGRKSLGRLAGLGAMVQVFGGGSAENWEVTVTASQQVTATVWAKNQGSSELQPVQIVFDLGGADGNQIENIEVGK